jgi:hypothetical protein
VFSFDDTSVKSGATTLRLTTFSKIGLRIKALGIMPRKNIFCKIKFKLFVLCFILQRVVILSAVMVSVIILLAFIISVIMPGVIMLILVR